MPVATAVHEELKQIQRELLDPDRDSPDPVLRLFAKNHLAPHARLRALYAARCQAEADVRRLNEKIAQADHELHQMRWEHLARWDQPTIETDIPTDKEAIAYATAKNKAELLHSLVEAWKGQVISYQLQLNDRGKEWDSAYETYRNLLWRLTGDDDVRPAWVVVDYRTDANGWRKPEGYELGTLEATKAQLEA